MTKDYFGILCTKYMNSENVPFLMNHYKGASMPALYSSRQLAETLSRAKNKSSLIQTKVVKITLNVEILDGS